MFTEGASGISGSLSHPAKHCSVVAETAASVIIDYVQKPSDGWEPGVSENFAVPTGRSMQLLLESTDAGTILLKSD